MQKFEPEVQGKRISDVGFLKGHDDELKSAVYSYVAGSGLVLLFHKRSTSPGDHRVDTKGNKSS